MTNRKMRDKMKKIAVYAQLFALTIVSVGSVSQTESKGQKKTNETKKVSKVKHKKAFKDLSKADKERINYSVSKCVEDGTEAAEEVNQLTDNPEEFKIGVRKVMDKYYSTKKKNRGQLKKFEKKIDDSAKEILENYEEAEEERENQKNLNYETEKVLVSFPHDTPMETIETIVENEAVDYEVIDDGKMDIPEELPKIKKERLEKNKDYKTDIVVLADVSLEDTVERAEDKFEEYDCVVAASDNTFFEADGTIETTFVAETNDPFFDDYEQWNLTYVDVPWAWAEMGFESKINPIWVAVIDCGVQMSHPDLSAVLMPDYSVDVTGTKDKKLIDGAESQQYTGRHGTMVAGVLMAQGDNGKMGAGIASMGSVPKFKNTFQLMAIKCDKSSSGRHITKAHLAEAIDYAVEHGAEVINISYSAPKSDYKGEYVDAIDSAVQKAIENDVIVVCSVGNDSSTEARYPASIPGVIGVGATFYNGNLATYSNESPDTVDIVAPGGLTDGVPIMSTCPTTDRTSGYRYSQGTSYATPLVAGTVAMMKGIDYSLTPAEALYYLQEYAPDEVRGRIDKNKTFKVLNAGLVVNQMDYHGYK